MPPRSITRTGVPVMSSEKTAASGSPGAPSMRAKHWKSAQRNV